MANDERVTLRLEVNADTKDLRKTQRELLQTAATAEAVDKRFESIGDNTQKLDDRTKRLNRTLPDANKNFAKYSKNMKVASNTLDDFNKRNSFFTRNLNSQGKAMRRHSRFMRGPFRLAIKLAAVEMLGMLAALSSVNGALAVGRALSRAWSSTVNALGVAAANAAAGIAAAIALFTQAQRQFAAAQASGSYGGNFAQSSRALRMVQADASLATFGVQGLTGAFAAASKNARVTGSTVASMRGLADFAVMSGDMEKGLAAAANLISLLQSGKAAGGEEVLSAASDLGPEFTKAFKEVLKSGKTTNAELLKMFASGDLAEAAGVSGTAGNVSGTFMGQLKTFATEFQVLFADIGQSFITPVQETFQKLNVIFRRTMAEISGNLYGFATGGFIDAIVWAAEKLSDFIVVLFNKYLPYTDQFIDNFVTKWRALSNWFSDGLERFRNGLNRFSAASTEVNKMLGTVFRGIGRGLRDNFVQMADWVVENSDKFQRFGESMADLFYNVIRFVGRLRQTIFDAEPAITQLVSAFVTVADVLVTIVEYMGKFIGLLGSISGTGPMGAVGAMLGMFGMMSGFSLIRGRGMGVGGKALGGLGMGAKMVGGGAIGAGLGTLAAFQLFNSMRGDNPGGVRDTAFLALRNASLAGLIPAFQLGSTMFAANKAGMLATKTLGPLSGGLAKQMALTTGRAGMMTPMLGAAGAAATAAAGMTITDAVVRNIMASKSMTNQEMLGIRKSDVVGYGAGIGGGAVTGATTAAILAQFVPVIGQFATPAVAFIGGLIGAVVGGVTTYIRRGQAQKDAKEAGAEFANVYADGIEGLLAAGGLRDAEAAFASFKDQLNDFAESQAYSDLVKNEGLKTGLERLDPLSRNIRAMRANVNDLSRAMGMSEDEVIAMTNAMEINLTSNLMTLQQLFEATGYAVQRFGEDFDQAFNTVVATAISEIDLAASILEAPAVINEAARGFREIALSGESTPSDFANFFRTAAEQTLMLAGGDPVLAFQNILENFGTADAPGTQFTTPGGVLFGLQDMVPDEILGAFIQTGRAGLEDLLFQNIIAAAAAEGFTVSESQVRAGLGGLSENRLLELARMSQSGTLNFVNGAGGNTRDSFAYEYMISQRTGGTFAPSVFTQNELGQLASINALGGADAGYLRDLLFRDVEQRLMDEGLSSGLFDILGVNIDTQRSENAKFLDDTSHMIVEAIKLSNDPLKDAIDLFNENIQKLIDAVGDGGDTFSPRRSLVDTMSKHSRFDMMIGGKRSVTSAYRTNMLGSGMSDHAAGRAYDLTGQNLGLYQTLVRANGGYADFHGAGGSRHLHVVPGNAPMGDAAVPRMLPPVASGGSSASAGDTITVNVYPSEGMDEQALATRVVERLERMNRNRNERM